MVENRSEDHDFVVEIDNVETVDKNLSPLKIGMLNSINSARSNCTVKSAGYG
jgi:hypothetical protein